MHDSHSAAFVAAISQVLLALFGVDYYAMLWAFVGSLVALSRSERMTRGRAVVYVFLSTLMGAALATGAVAFFNTSARPVLIAVSLIGGAGSQLIVTTLVRGVLSRIQTTLGGATNEPAESSH